MTNNFIPPAAGEIAEWLSKLVQIPSVNPVQAGGDKSISGEKRMADAVTEWFTRFGAEIEIDEVFSGRPSVYAIWRNSSSERWRAVDVHTDTVGVDLMTEFPFSGDIVNGQVHGRGAVDTKATLAIVLALLEKLHESGTKLDFNLLVAATADEETGMGGARAFSRWVPQQGFRLNELLVAEPTLCKPAVGHNGNVRLIFHIQGKEAHSSKPEQGQNAIVAATHLISALKNEHDRLQTLPPLPPLGHGKLTVTIVEGGSGLNVVPGSCKISVDRRTLPGEDYKEIWAEMRKMAKDNCPLPVTVEYMSRLNAFMQATDTPWVQSLAAFTGSKPISMPYGTNAAHYGGLADEIVVMGPGTIDHAHGPEEWVEISELERMQDIILNWWELD
jgi:acetylornithine deacetylase/succinyl-diaminopimelate desuccinylase-like protein